MFPIEGRARRLVWRLGRKLYCSARREPPNAFLINGEGDLQVAVLEQLVRSSAGPHWILDIGANVGEWTKHGLDFVARRGAPDVVFHAFEPIPSTCQMLRGNLASGIKAGRVVANEVGLAQFAGTATFRSDAERSGTNSILPAGSVEPSPSATSVTVTSIDEYIAARGIDRIALAKIDTEGNDFNVILGAEKLLAAEGIDVIQFEYNHRWVFFRRFLKDVFDFFEGRPYRIGKLSRGRIELFTAWHPELERFFETNYVVVHDRFLGALPIYRGAFDGSNSYA